MSEMIARGPRRTVRAAATVIASLAVLMCSACGGRTQPVEFKTQVVTGKILLASGKPLTKGRVVLLPKQEPMLPLYGKLQPDGTFTLSAGGLGAGVSHGEFQVSIEPDGYFPGSKNKPKGLPYPPKYIDSDNGLNVTITPDTKELPPITLN